MIALACDLTNSWPDEILDEKTDMQIRLAAGLRARVENEKSKAMKMGMK